MALVTDLVNDLMQDAKAILKGEPPSSNLRVVSRTDQATPVAFLVTLDHLPTNLVLPLAEGRNLVGRRGPYGTWPPPAKEPTVFESYQWFIECTAGRAKAWDAATTNLSVLIPAATVATVNLGTGEAGFLELFQAPGAIPLPHPSAPGPHAHELHEGDVLRGFYGAFAFGWLSPGK